MKSRDYKINAVILLGTDWKLKQVKQALLLDDETLRSYLERYGEGSVKALIHTDYSGRPSGLSRTVTMIGLLRHRQTKGAATDRFDLWCGKPVFYTIRVFAE